MIAYYFLAILTMILYLYSFFPVSKNISLKHDLPSKLQDYSFNVEQILDSSIDKVILIVIDALRYDFITYNNTPKIIKFLEKDGCLSLVVVESPTVTLPRIKALTTGSVPQFIDVVLNLLDTESAVDSILHRAADKGKKIVFYGDNTWLKLYPNEFVRNEGTSSFYVYDYTEVDNNVTRNMREELQKSDWDVMILHYLGLDHIGHISGPFSPLIQPKLNEMDEIVNEIYISTKNYSRLIVITGDHGMKDSGGHGGTTYAEMNVPLVLLGQACVSDQISQSDIPVILSTFMGLPFPSNSIGKISTKLLSSLSIQKILYFLRYNTLLLVNKTNICREKLDIASDLHYQLLRSNNFSVVSDTVHLYEDCLNSMSSHLLKQSVTQENFNLILCLLIFIFCLIGASVKALHNENLGKFKEFVVSIFILSIFPGIWNQHFLMLFCFIILSFIAHKVIKIAKIILNLEKNVIVIFVVLNLMHSISMISSSFIEEEHQTWYFLFTTFLLVISIKDRKVHMLLVVLCFRFIRKINQTGDKWAAEVDISQWLLAPDKYIYYQVFYIVSLVSTGLVTFKIYCSNKMNKCLSVIILVLIYIFKIHTQNYIFLGQVIWFLILLNFILALHITIKSLINVWILIICLLYRPQNIILIPFTIFTSIILSQQIQSCTILSILHFWIGNVLYFCQGHSNSLASIDIAAGYVGLKDYKPIYVLLQILCHTYSLPILTNLLLLSYYQNLSIWNVFIVFRLLIIVTTYTIAYIQRQHLFIWSVFAPKILLEFGHTLILLMQMSLHYTIVHINNMLNKNIFKTYPIYSTYVHH